jgi:flagellar motor switch protein FliM
MRLSELARLKPGDIIPIDMPESVLLLANGIATYRGKMGQANGNLAVKITEKVRRPESDGSKQSRLSQLKEQMKTD